MEARRGIERIEGAKKEKEARKLLQLAKTLESEGRISIALKQYGKIAQQFPNTTAAVEARRGIEQIKEEKARKLLQIAKTLESEGNILTALKQYGEIAIEFPGTTAAKVARLGIERTTKEVEARKLLQFAKTLESDRKILTALNKYGKIARQFPNTTAAKEARLDIKRLAGAKKKEEAKNLLRLAKSMESAGRIPMAVKRYGRIVQQFPNTIAGKEAHRALERIEGE